MKQKQLIIIRNHLEYLSAFFEHLIQILPYEIILINIEEMLQGKISENLQDAKIYDTLLAIETRVFRDNEQEIREYFKKIFDTPFLNLLQLYTELDEYEEAFLEKQNENCFILFRDLDQEKAATFFYMYVREIYSKATVSFRLSDYIYNSFKGVVYSEILKQKKMEIERLNQELEQRNRIDPLTNLFNRRALFEFLEKERNRTLRNLFKIGAKQLEAQKKKNLPPQERRTFTPDFIEGNIILFSIMMIDLDKFKEINDTHGHLSGDVVLKTVGNIFRNTGILREQDVVGRFGGEEFIVILPGTNARNAKKPARRLAKELERRTFEDTEGNLFRVTMSVGISEYHPHDNTGDAIIQRADKALYVAKENGRNLTIVYEEQFPE